MIFDAMASKLFTIDAFLSKTSKTKSARLQSVVIIDSDDSDDEGLRGEVRDSDSSNAVTSSCHVSSHMFTESQISCHVLTELTVTDTSFDSETVSAHV